MVYTFLLKLRIEYFHFDDIALYRPNVLNISKDYRQQNYGPHT